MFTAFRRTLELLTDQVPGAAVYHGSLPRAEKERTITAFRDEAQVLLSHRVRRGGAQSPVLPRDGEHGPAVEPDAPSAASPASRSPRRRDRARHRRQHGRLLGHRFRAHPAAAVPAARAAGETLGEQPGLLSHGALAGQLPRLEAPDPSFATMGALHQISVNLVGQGEPQRLEGAAVTAEVLPLLGVRPILGACSPPPTIARRAGTVVLSHGLWQRELGGDPRVLGRRVLLDGEPFVVIGVMPRDFYFPAASRCCGCRCASRP